MSPEHAGRGARVAHRRGGARGKRRAASPASAGAWLELCRGSCMWATLCSFASRLSEKKSHARGRGKSQKDASRGSRIWRFYRRGGHLSGRMSIVTEALVERKSTIVLVYRPLPCISRLHPPCSHARPRRRGDRYSEDMPCKARFAAVDRRSGEYPAIRSYETRRGFADEVRRRPCLGCPSLPLAATPVVRMSTEISLYPLGL